MFVGGVLGTLFTTVPLIAALRPGTVALQTHAEFVAWAAGLLVVILGLGFWARDSMTRTLVNRRIFATGVIVFVAQMGIVFAVGEADETSDHLRQRLRDRYSQLVGFCIMLFALISTPCIATFAITRQEAGSVKWALAQTIGLTTLAWIMTFLVYQGGLLLGWGVA